VRATEAVNVARFRLDLVSCSFREDAVLKSTMRSETVVLVVSQSVQ